MTDLWPYQVCFSSYKYSKTRFRPGLRPGPAGGAYCAPQTP